MTHTGMFSEVEPAACPPLRRLYDGSLPNHHCIWAVLHGHVPGSALVDVEPVVRLSAR